MIYKNKLISPITGYSCKRITKQNIKKFGFNSIEELLNYNPNQKLECDEYIKNRNNKPALIAQQNEKLKRISNYNLNPNKCKQCNVILDYSHRHRKFHNRSCAAKYNNIKTPKHGSLRLHIIKCSNCKTDCNVNVHVSKLFCVACRKTCLAKPKKRKRKSTRILKIKTVKHKNFIGPKIYYCKHCPNIRNGPSAKYCGKCITNIRHYRSLCEFKFNVYEFPNEFEIHLINKYGWFSPNGYKRRNKTPNLNGVSKDHLYTIADGFSNNIDPNMLAHPANCKIMIHNGKDGNNSKKKSSLTVEDLEKRITEWNKKYGDY